MAKHHFVHEYERLVEFLLRTKPVDEAMSLAVGGLYREFGIIEFEILRWAGLKDGMTLIDLGCGSGRLAHVVGERAAVDFIGIDVVQSLLDYAQSKSPPHYKFILNHDLTIPAPDSSADLSPHSACSHIFCRPKATSTCRTSGASCGPGAAWCFHFLNSPTRPTGAILRTRSRRVGRGLCRTSTRILNDRSSGDGVPSWGTFARPLSRATKRRGRASRWGNRPRCCRKGNRDQCIVAWPIKALRLPTRLHELVPGCIPGVEHLLFEPYSVYWWLRGWRSRRRLQIGNRCLF
jgi:Methyltransferase domain